MIKIKTKKINAYSVVPSKANGDDGNLCFDLYCDTPFTIAPGELKLIDTGLMLEMPKGVGIRILERSSSPLKKNIEITAGTIHSNFTQFEVKIMAKKFEPISLWTALKIAKSRMTFFFAKKPLTNTPYTKHAEIPYEKRTHWAKVLPMAWKIWRERNSTDTYQAGERIAQMLVVPSLATSFVETKKTKKTKRTGGFGSTGNK